MITEIGNDLIDGTKEVFETMLMVDVTASHPEVGGVCELPSQLSSIIGLGGEIKGMIAVHCTDSAAMGITAAMLGMDVDSLDEDVQDAVGEIANMVAGNIKIAFEKYGKAIKLAIPSTVIGKDYKVAGLGGAHSVCVNFLMDDKEFVIELKYISL